MSIAEKSRAFMVREHQQIKHRQHSILMRVAQEFGFRKELSHYWNPTQGKIDPTMRIIYRRSNATMS